jgi:hypothetical protein
LLASALTSGLLLACAMGGSGDEAARGAILMPVCAPSLQRCAVDFTFGGGASPADALVEIRGSWAPDAWTAGEPMTSYGTTWRRTLLLPPGGRVEYKYCVDPDANGQCARWETDPSRPTDGPFGNNVVDTTGCQPTACLPESGPVPRTIRFIAVGDTGYEGVNSVSTAMSEKCQAEGCDFVLMLGDNIYPDGASSPTDPAFRGTFEEKFAAVHAPFHVALGNHDYGGDGAGNEYERAQNEVDYTRNSRKWRLPSRYYQFSAGAVDFFALDTNAQMYSLDAQQRTDVKAWLAASQAPWKIVFGHHPYLSNGPHGNAGTYDGNPQMPVFNGVQVKAFAEEVYCGVADLYLAGHDHTRQWMTDTCNGTHLALSGAGATSTALPGANATKFQSVDLGFLYVVIDGPKLTAEFVNGANVVEFTTTLEKQAAR